MEGPRVDFLVPSQSTLVKYNNPEEVPPAPPPPPSPRNRVETLKQKSDTAGGDTGGNKDIISFSPNQLICKDLGKAGLEVDQVLDLLLPPRQWTQDDVEMRQTVSSKPATRLDVINLREQLNMRLEARQARPSGICLIRRELYDQCFDELIRQIAINCPERGLVLLRIRDEIRMTQGAYRILYEQATAHVLKKEAQADEGIEELEQKYEQAVKQRKGMLDAIQARKIQIEQVERRHLEFIQAEEERFKKESEFLKRAYVQIQEQQERIINYDAKAK